MKLKDMSLEEYLNALQSEAPAPGGGSAGALCGAQGAALVCMVANLTVGKNKYADEWQLCTEIAQKSAALKEELLSQVDSDTEAFNLVSVAYKLPKDTEEQKSARSKAILKATLVATEVPLKTMKLCLAALYCAKALVGHSNQSAASDLGVAALNLGAGAKSAYLNVLINLGGIPEDRAAAFRTESERLLVAAEAEAENICAAVLKTL